MALHSPEKTEDHHDRQKEGDNIAPEKLAPVLKQTWQQRPETPPSADQTSALTHLPPMGVPGRETLPPPIRLADAGATRATDATALPDGSAVRRGHAGRDNTVTPAELEFVRPGVPGASDAERIKHWQSVKELVAGGGDPGQALLSAVESNRLVGIGDHHVNDIAPTSPMYDMLKGQMRELAARGVKDMFIEFPQVLQPVFDAFNRDPDKGGLVVPAKITGADGQPLTTPEAEGGLKFLNETRKMFPQTVEMWRAARDAGIRIHAVDSDYNAYGRSTQQIPFEERNKRQEQLKRERDSTMAANMRRVLQESDGKAIALLGLLHVAANSGVSEPNAFQMIAPFLAKRNEKAAGIATLVGSLPGANESTLYPLTSQISAPTAVPTHDANGKPNSLADINFLHTDRSQLPVGNFDHVFLFPNEETKPKFDREAALAIRDRADVANTQTGRQFSQLVERGINWSQMPPADFDKGGNVAKQVLDRMLFNNGGVKPEGFDQLQSALGVPAQAGRDVKDVDYVVIGSRGHWEHGAKVESALRSGDPSAGNKNIVNLWLPVSPPAVPEHLQPKNAAVADRPVLNEAQSYSLAVQKDLDRARAFSESVVNSGGKAPDVIVPQTVSPYYLGKGDALGISHQELGVEPLNPGQLADAQYKQQVLDGLKRLAESGDVRAESVLGTLDSLHKLADKSKVYLSANNEDKLDLAVFLGDMHPNVISVSSIDQQNQTAQYNEQTAKFAKSLAYGSVVSIPENARPELDMNQFSHVIVREPDESDKLAGSNVGDHTLDESQFKNLQTEHAAFINTAAYMNIAETFYRARGQLVYEGELAPEHLQTIARQSAVLQDALQPSGTAGLLPDNFANMTDSQKQEVIRNVLTDRAKTRLVRDGLYRAADMSMAEAKKTLTPEQIRDRGQDPNNSESSATSSYLAWYHDIERRMSDKLLTFEQTRALHAKARPDKAYQGEAPAELKPLLFNPEEPLMSQLHEYISAPTRSGRTIALGIEVGNSFSAPYLAARERYRQQNQ